MKKRSDIMVRALDLAADLQDVGALDKAALRDIEALAVPAVRAFRAKDIRAIREANRLSQAVLPNI